MDDRGELERDPERRRRLGIIRGAGQSLLGLLNDILDLSKMEAGKLSVTNDPFSPRESIEHVCGLFEARFADKPRSTGSWTASMPPSPPPMSICPR